MKKALCLLLSLSMIFTTSFTLAISATAIDLSGLGLEENYDVSGFEFDSFGDGDYALDLEELLGDEEALKSTSILGYNLYDYYEGLDNFNWAQVDSELGYTDYLLAKANLNTYLKRALTTLIGDDNLYTVEYALLMTNFIGDLLDPNFEDITYADDLRTIFTTEKVSSDVFYATVADLSGLSKIFEYNIISSGKTLNYTTFFASLGMDFEDITDEQLKDSSLFAAALIESFINSLLSDGPIEFVCNFLNINSALYDVTVKDTVVALLTKWINNGSATGGESIKVEDIDDMTGFINFIFNRCDETDTDSLQFSTLPEGRFAHADNTTDVFFFLLIYGNINAQYENNAAVVDEIQKVILAEDGLDIADRERISTILGGMCGDSDDLVGMVELLVELYVENVEEGISSLFTNIQNAFATLFAEIIAFFDRLFFLA